MEAGLPQCRPSPGCTGPGPLSLLLRGLRERLWLGEGGTPVLLRPGQEKVPGILVALCSDF